MNIFIRSIIISSFVCSCMLSAFNDDVDVPPSTGKQQQSDSFTGGDDSFAKFLEELEKELAKESSTETDKPTPKPSLSPQAKKEDKGTATVTSGYEPEKTDPESLFIDPATLLITQGKQKHAEPTSKSLAAFKTVANDYIATLNELKKIVASTIHFEPGFKEKFSNAYREVIEKIAITLDQIESNEAYVKLFLVPPDTNKQLVSSTKQLRKNIIDSLHDIKALNTKLTTRVAQEAEVEIIEELEAEETVQQLANEPKKALAEQPKKPKQESVPTTPTKTSAPKEIEK